MYKYIHTAMHVKINVPEGSLSGVSALAVGAGGCGSGFGGFFIGSRTGFFLVGAGAAGLLGITGAWRRKREERVIAQGRGGYTPERHSHMHFPED